MTERRMPHELQSGVSGVGRIDWFGFVAAKPVDL
jgi:hypothetical protein